MPPEGFEFDAGMAVTYSLDLRSLLAVPMALTHSDPDGTAHESVDAAVGTASQTDQTPVALLAALKRCANRLTVIVQHGHIAAPRAHRVFSLLEDCVIGASAPADDKAVVHAKAWVLRYLSSADAAESHLRVRRSFFDEVLPGREAELVARESELDRLDIPSLNAEGHVSATFAFDAGDGYEASDDSEADDDAAPETPAESLSDLHAKLYLFDRPKRRSSLFVGSANATRSAFSRNVELLLQLEGPTKTAGIEALVGSADVHHDQVTLRQMSADTRERARELRAGSMGSLQFMLPSPALAELGDPLTGDDSQSVGPARPLADLRAQVAEKIAEALRPLLDAEEQAALDRSLEHATRWSAEGGSALRRRQPRGIAR